MSEADEVGGLDILKLLWPYLVVTGLLTAVAVLLFLRFAPVSLGATAPPRVVTFDVIKYINAERAIASKFLGKNAGNSNAVEVLSDLPKRTRDAIAQAAGPGTLVVVRQFVVQGQAQDITDKVLRELSLPTQVPTADATHQALGPFQTDFATPPPAYNPKPLGPAAQGSTLP